jgi:hypothetical protein
MLYMQRIWLCVLRELPAKQFLYKQETVYMQRIRLCVLRELPANSSYT